MTTIIRLSSQLFKKVREDLLRPHAYAGERVGFLFSRPVSSNTSLILMSSYSSIADNDYIENTCVGACINSTAIRKVMQRALNESCGAFHVHLHEFKGKPQFSRIDKCEIIRLIPSFQAVSPKSAHGALIFNDNNCAAMVWTPGQKKPESTARISIIGWSIKFLGEF